MTYYIATTVPLDFDQAVARTEAALAGQGFGVITRVDIRETFQKKLGVEFRPYTILGACNPKLAHHALQLEDKVGTMLPCNVVVQQLADGNSEVAAIDPVASMQAIPNPQLLEAASEVRERLAKVIETLQAGQAASAS